MGAALTYMGGIFRRGEPKTRIKGLKPRIGNIFRNNYRGFLGTLIILVAGAVTYTGEFHQSVMFMWIAMATLFLFQSVNVPVVGFVPIFMLPMLGVMDSGTTCACYMNEFILLYLLSGMAVLLWSNSGLDRRVALCFLNHNAKPEKYNAKQLIIRTGTASFILSILSSKLIVTSFMTEYVTKTLMDMRYATSKGGDSNYDKVRAVVCNTIQTCSSIGSFVLPHTSVAMIAARMIFYESAPSFLTYPDIFNYFQFVAFSFPVALVMLIVNLIYNTLLLCKEPKMSAWGMKTLRAAMLKNKEGMPKKMTLHEKLTLVAKVLLLLTLLSRWSLFFTDEYTGWSDYMVESGGLPVIKDTTVFATFVILLHILPKGFGFTRFFRCKKFKKRSQLGPIKSESAILFWRYVDKNLNYGYIFLLGSGVALVNSARESTLGLLISESLMPIFEYLDIEETILIVCLVAVILANIMTSVAACIILLPYVLMISMGPGTPADWTNKTYLFMLAVGGGTTFGFCCPFLYTPAYFCHYMGKVPVKKMAKYGAGSAVICMIILAASLISYAPALWDPNGAGIGMVYGPIQAGATFSTVTASTDSKSPDTIEDNVPTGEPEP